MKYVNLFFLLFFFPTLIIDYSNDFSKIKTTFCLIFKSNECYLEDKLLLIDSKSASSSGSSSWFKIVDYGILNSNRQSRSVTYHKSFQPIRIKIEDGKIYDIVYFSKFDLDRKHLFSNKPSSIFFGDVLKILMYLYAILILILFFFKKFKYVYRV